MARRRTTVTPANTGPIIKDFRNFLFLVWQHLTLPPPTKLQYEIADYLQHGPPRQIIEAFRGIGKSWITSAYVLWRLLCDPQDKFLVVSASKTRADDFSTFTLRLINEMPILQHLKPTDDDRHSKIAFDVGPSLAAHAPSVKSAGIFGMITGGRANHIISDDVEIPNNSGTEDLRDKLIKAVSEFNAIVVPGGRITLLGTPQTEDSIYTKLQDLGYEAKIWPARYPGDLDKYGSKLADSIREAVLKDPNVIGKPTDPVRFDEADLFERAISMGPSQFTLQYMLDCSMSDRERYPLRLSDLIVMDLDTNKAPIFVQYGSSPDLQIKELRNVGLDGDRWYRPMTTDNEWVEYEGSILFIDPSGRGADRCGYAVVKQLGGKLFVLTAGAMEGGYEEPTLERLATIAGTHKVNEIVIEANFGDGMFTKILAPVSARIYPCKLSEVKNHVQKEKRICDVLEPVMASHRLVVNRSIVEADIRRIEQDPRHSLFFQMTRITRERRALVHDDAIDALAGAVAYWTKSMAKDQEKSKENYRTKMLKEELKWYQRGKLLKMTNNLGKTVKHIMGRSKRT